MQLNSVQKSAAPLMMMYVFGASAACNADQMAQAATTEASWASTGSGQAVRYFTPPQSGWYYIAVDGASQDDFGAFTLDVKELIAPAPHAQCATPKVLTFTGNQATITDEVGEASADKIDVTCNGSPAPVPLGIHWNFQRKHYRFSAAANQSYKISATPADPTQTIRFFVAPLDVACDMKKLTAYCSNKPDANSVDFREAYAKHIRGSYLHFVPRQAGDYMIVVWTYTGKGSPEYTLTIDSSAAPENGTCSKAQPVSFFSDVATMTGTTAFVVDDQLKLQCSVTNQVLRGAQRYYKVDLKAGQPYAVSAKADFDGAAVYLASSTSCDPSALQAACNRVTGPATIFLTRGHLSRKFYVPQVSGEHLVVIDGTDDTLGNFEIQIAQTPPLLPHRYCKDAKPLAFVNDKIAIEDDLTRGINEFDQLDCANPNENRINGPQLYYKVTLKKDELYRVQWVSKEMNLSSAYMFPESAQCQPEALTSACNKKTTDGSYAETVWSKSEKQYHGTLDFKAPYSGNWILAIDHASVIYSGKFSLTIERAKTLTNGDCTAAQPVNIAAQSTTKVGGTFLVTQEATNENSPCEIVGCSLCKTQRGYAYYRTKLTQGSRYRFKLVSDKRAHLAIVRANTACDYLKMQPDCNSEGTTGALMVVSPYEESELLFSPTVSADYLVVVFNRYKEVAVTFSLSADVIEAQPAHQTCTQAKPVALTASPVVISENTALAANEFAKQISCSLTSGYPQNGGQLYYRMRLKGGTIYRLTCEHHSDAQGKVYAFKPSAACDPLHIQNQCMHYPTALCNSGGSTALTLAEFYDTDYIIAVDANNIFTENSPLGGPFNLKINW